MKVWTVTRRDGGASCTEDVFGSEEAAMAHVEGRLRNELVTIRPDWRRLDDRLVWTVRDKDAFGRPALLEFWISPYVVKAVESEAAAPGVEVLEPPPSGAWTHEWTCKAKGCGAKLRARAEDVRYSYHEDCETPYSSDCPFCGTWAYIKDVPPLVASRAKRT